jgi:hypothetical protein
MFVLGGSLAVSKGLARHQPGPVWRRAPAALGQLSDVGIMVL